MIGSDPEIDMIRLSWNRIDGLRYRIAVGIHIYICTYRTCIGNVPRVAPRVTTIMLHADEPNSKPGSIIIFADAITVVKSPTAAAKGTVIEEERFIN